MIVQCVKSEERREPPLPSALGVRNSLCALFMSPFPLRDRAVANPSTPHQSMPAQRESGRVEPRLPAVSGADGGTIVEEAVFFFLLGQLGEFGVEWVFGWEERLFAMQDWRVGAGLKFKAIDLAGAE